MKKQKIKIITVSNEKWDKWMKKLSKCTIIWSLPVSDEVINEIMKEETPKWV